MKKLMACVVVLFLFTALVSESYANTYINYYSGNDLVRWMREYEKVLGGATDREANFGNAAWFEGYIMGVYEGTAGEGAYKYKTMTKEVTVGQIVAVVIKYLKAHPETWHKNAHRLVVQALLDTFSTRDLLKNGKK